jgi:transcriptional regulator with XRE-family HTH domain
MEQWTPEEIRELRESHNLFQKDFAELLGVSRVYVNYLEKGVKRPSKTLMKLLDCMEAVTGFYLERQKKTKNKGERKHGKADAGTL